MTIEKTTLARFEFLGEMNRGRKFEGEVQKEIKDATCGMAYNNLRIDRMEFDIIVVDYPLMSFVEIKAYRANFKGREIEKALIKLVRNCATVTEDTSLSYRDWVPRSAKWETCGNRKWLLKKLGCTVMGGWRFRMMLIVPDRSFKGIMSAICGKRDSSNLLDIENYPLLVIPRKRIKEVF